jgi:excisionase family DNA binding protein
MPLHLKNDRILTMQEAAAYLGYSEHTIRKYIARNLLSASKFGNTVILAKSECDRFSKEKRSRGRPAKKF